MKHNNFKTLIGATAAALLVLSAPAQASQHEGQLTKMVSSFASQSLVGDFLQTVTSSNFKFEARKTSGGGSIGRSSSVSRSAPSRSDSVSRSSSSSSKSSNTSSGSNSNSLWGNKKSDSGSSTSSSWWGKKKETPAPNPTPSKNNNTYSKGTSGTSNGGNTTIVNNNSGGSWDFLMGYLLAKATTPSHSTPAPAPQAKSVDNSMSDLNVNGTDIGKGTILDKVPQKIKPELDGRINSLRTIEAKVGISDGSSKPKIK